MPLTAINVKIESWQYEAAKLGKLNLSKLLRKALDEYFNSVDGTDNLEKEEEDLQKQELEMHLKKTVLGEKKRKLQDEKHREELNSERMQWIEQHPQALSMYKDGSITTKGWQNLCRELKFTNKKHAEDFLSKTLTELENTKKEVTVIGNDK